MGTVSNFIAVVFNKRVNIIITSMPGPTPNILIQNLQATVGVKRAPHDSDTYPQLRNTLSLEDAYAAFRPLQ